MKEIILRSSEVLSLNIRSLKAISNGSVMIIILFSFLEEKAVAGTGYPEGYDCHGDCTHV